jgi:hypothetical protein
MAMTMTDEEAWALEEKFASGNITLSGKPGALSRERDFLRQLDDVSANYIMTKAEATHKTPAQIIGELVRSAISASAL